MLFQEMDPDLKLHDLIDFSWSKAALTNILENIDDDFTWLEEILTECKNKFSLTSVKLLPKTPSQKKHARKRARGVIESVDLEVLSERPDEYEPACASTPCRPTSTPVRRLRSRSVQSSAATRVTRSSRAVVNKKKEKENTAPGPIMDLMNINRGNLPSVTENLDVEMIPQTPPTTTKSKTVTLADSGGRNVRQKALEYEHMLVGKQRVSSSPRTAQQLVINQKHVQTEAETNNIISHVRRSSTSSRRSSAAGKRKSLKVLASKVRLRSLHGKPSLTIVHTRLIEQEGTQEIACEASVETGSEETHEAEHEKSKNEEPEETKQPAAGKPQASRTRLRLKKSKNDTKTASESNSTSGSTTDSAKETDLITSCSNDKDTQPTASTRTKRKKQKSQSSEDEDLKVPAKVAKGSASRVSSENEVKTRTRTRTQKANENVDCDVSQDDVFEAPEAEGPTKTVSDTTGTLSAGEQQNNEQLLATDSGSNDSGVSSTANATNCVDAKKAEVTDTDSERETAQEELSVSSEVKNATSSSVSDSVSADKETDGGQQDSKAADSSRRATRVISNAATSSSEEAKSEEEAQQDQLCAQMKEESASGDSQVEEDAQPMRQTRTKTRKAQAAKTQAKDAEKQEEVEQTRTTRTKTRKRHADEDADTSVSKRSCMSTPPRQQGESQSKTLTNEVMEIDDEGADADDDSDYEDIETYPSEKVSRPVTSFLNQLKKKSFTRPASLVSGVVTSFLKQNTPAKAAFQMVQAQKKKELLMKEKREQERLKKMDELKQNKVEEQKRKREERMRKVAEMREMRQKKENDLRRNLEEKLKEKLNSTDRMKEDRCKEEREKQRMRLKKQMEAEERRRQEEEERVKKLLEQQEEQKRHEEFLARKREHEEQERQKRMAEERKKLEDKQMEMERERQVENERLFQQELARERERQLQKEQKEKAAQAERAEREKIEMEKRKERELKIQKDLEKLKEMEQQRLAKMAAAEEEKRKEEARLEQIIQQHNHKLQALRVNATTLTLSNATSTTLTVTATTTTGTSATVVGNQNHDPNSYPISPVRQRKNGSVENYDIGDLRSDDSTDDDAAPRKKIPSWAQGANLKAMLINQVYHPPDLDKIFAYIEPPNLNEMFERKRPRFNKRTSSAIWNSPLHKPQC